MLLKGLASLGDALATVTLPTFLYHVLLSVPVFRTMGLLHDWLTPANVQVVYH